MVTRNGSKKCLQSTTIASIDGVRNPPGSKKKAYVYVKKGNRDVKVSFGDPNIMIKSRQVFLFYCCIGDPACGVFPALPFSDTTASNTELHFELVIIVTPTLDLDGKLDTGLADNGSQYMLVMIIDPFKDYIQSTIAPLDGINCLRGIFMRGGDYSASPAPGLASIRSTGSASI